MTTAQATISPARRSSLAWPLLLIFGGIVFLLANAGLITGDVWRHLAALWPLVLVLIGVDLLIRPRSLPVALVVEIALIAAAVAYAVVGPAILPANANFNASVVRNGASQLDLRLSYGAGSLVLAGGASDLVNVASTRQDVEVTSSAGTVTVRPSNEAFPFGTDRRWTVGIPSDLPTALNVDLGAGDFTVDLSSVRLSRATINAGASDLKVTLPHPNGDVPIRITGGASSMTVTVPAGVEYRVSVDGGLTSTTGPTQSSGYATAKDRVDLSISAGASSIQIRLGGLQ